MAKDLNKNLSRHARRLILNQNLTEEEVEVLDKELTDTGSSGEGKALAKVDEIGGSKNVKEDDESDTKDKDGEDKEKVEEDDDSMAKVRAAKKDGGKDDDKEDDDKVEEATDDEDKDADEKDDKKVEEASDEDEKDDDKEDEKDEVKEAADDKWDWDDEDLKEADGDKEDDKKDGEDKVEEDDESDTKDKDGEDKEKVEEDHEELSNKPAAELGSTGKEPAANNDSDVKILSKVSEEADDDEDDDKEKVEEDDDSMAKVRAAKKDGGKDDGDDKEDKKDDKKVEESRLIKYRRANKSSTERKAQQKQIKEAVKAIFKGADLSPEFLTKAETVFEAALNKRVIEEAKAIDKVARRAVQNRVSKTKTNLEEKINGYLGRVVKEWMKENQVAVEQGIRVELAESFLTELKVLFERHNIEVPANKVNLYDQQNKKIAALSEQVNKLSDKLVSTEKELFEAQKLDVLVDVSDGLAATQVAKLKTLTEDIDAKDIGTFKKKALVIRESFFNSKAKETTENKDETNGKGKDSFMEKMIEFSAKQAKND